MTSVCLFFSFLFFFFFLFQGTTNGLSNRVRTWMTRTDDKPTRRYPALGKRLFMIRHHRCGQNSRRIGFTVGNSVRSPRRVSNRQSGPRDYCSYFPWTIVLFFFFFYLYHPYINPFSLSIPFSRISVPMDESIDRRVTHEFQTLRFFYNVRGKILIDSSEKRYRELAAWKRSIRMLLYTCFCS